MTTDSFSYQSKQPTPECYQVWQLVVQFQTPGQQPYDVMIDFIVLYIYPPQNG